MGKKIKCIGRYVMDGVTLGKGNFAHVELATHSVTEVKVAIKIIDTRKIKDEYVRTHLHREAKIMTSLRHPNIIRLYETLKAQTLYCLVTEYAPGGELLEYIKCHPDRKLGESASRPFVRQLVSALDYLHGRNIVHRDLKMENIMLDEKKKSIKLIDFGLSNICKPEEPLKTHCGSPEYAAPELFIVGRTYGPEIDLWSLGIIMYAMILGRLPFSTQFRDEYHRQRMLQQIQKGLSPVHDREMQVLTADCRNLFHQLIEPNPELRIPLQEIFIHQWLTKNGRSPFYTYAPPPRNKALRNEIVGALSIMMDMKKGVVNETVKEHRADELSAMYNMMLEQKLKKLGYCDIDHTKKTWQGRTTRSRSADKSTTPESSKGKALMSKRTAGKKSGVGSKARPKNKMATGNPGHTPSQQSTVTFAGQGQSQLDRPRLDDPLSTISSRPCTPLGTVQSPGARDKRGIFGNPIHPAGVSLQLHNPAFPYPPAPIVVEGSGLTGNNGSGQPTHHQRLFMSGSTDYSRIPLSQRRVPPPKLSLTLDLSITNPGTSSRLKKDQVAAAQKDLQFQQQQQQHAGSCQHGIAASSGVPPRLSPKEDSTGKHAHHATSNPTSRSANAPATISTSSSASTASTSTTMKQIFSGTVSKARRPSSLQYCLKTSSGRLARPSLVPGLSTASSRRSSVPVEQGGSQRSNSISSHGGRKEINVVAPKATPEDSLIDSCSEDTASSNSDLSEISSVADVARPPTMRLPRREERFLGTLAEIVEVVGDSSQMLDELDDEEADAELDRPTESVKVRFEERTEAKMGLSRFSNNFELCRDEAQKLAVGARGSRETSDATLTPISNYLSFNHSRDPSLLFTVSSPNLPPRAFQETSRTSLETQSAAIVATTSAPAVEQSTSDQVIVSPYLYQPWLHTHAGLKTLSRSDRPPPLVPNSPVESNISSGSLRPRLPMKLDFSAGSGLSPGSPSYDDKHARFSHIGIHALDVFFSPEEDLTPSSEKESCSETLWRPLVTTVTTRSDKLNQTAPCKSPASFGSTALLKKSTYTSPPYIDAKTPTPVEEQQPEPKPIARRPLSLPQQPQELSNLCMPMPRAPLVTSLDIFCDGSTDDDDDDDDDDVDPDNLRDENGNETKNCLDKILKMSAFCDEKSDAALSQMSCSSVREVKSTPVSIRQTFNSETILSSKLERLGATDQEESDSFIPSPVTLIQHSVTCADMPSVLTVHNASITHTEVDPSAYKDHSPNAATTANLVTSWLKLPQTSQHKDGHSPGCGTVWPADLNICTRNTVASMQRKHSSSSGLSLDSLEDAKTNGSSEVVATCSLAAKLRGGSFRLPKMASNNEDSAASIQSKDSRILMPSFKNPIPVFSNLLRRERRVANDTKNSSANVNKSPSKKNLEPKSSADSFKSTWRQGLAQWLHISRSSSQSKAVNSNNNNNNNNNNNSCRPVAKHHHRAYRPQQVNSNNSAPMCITLISNHGRKSSLTISNNVITKTSDFHQDKILYDRQENQEVSIQTRKLSTVTEGLTKLCDKEPSVQDSSPMSKLRQRKTIDWKECQKCTEAIHSSDESPEAMTMDNMPSLTSSVEASMPFHLTNNVTSQNWSTT